jgi:hypothetical protein
MGSLFKAQTPLPQPPKLGKLDVALSAAELEIVEEALRRHRQAESIRRQISGPSWDYDKECERVMNEALTEIKKLQA